MAWVTLEKGTIYSVEDAEGNLSYERELEEDMVVRKVSETNDTISYEKDDGTILYVRKNKWKI